MLAKYRNGLIALLLVVVMLGMVCVIAWRNEVVSQTPQQNAYMNIMDKLNNFPKDYYYATAPETFVADKQLAGKIIHAICYGDLEQLQEVVNVTQVYNLERVIRLVSYAIERSQSGFEIWHWRWDSTGAAVQHVSIFPSVISLKSGDLMLTLKANHPAEVYECVMRQKGSSKTFEWKLSKKKTALELLPTIGKDMVEKVNTRKDNAKCLQ